MMKVVTDVATTSQGLHAPALDCLVLGQQQLLTEVARAFNCHPVLEAAQRLNLLQSVTMQSDLSSSVAKVGEEREFLRSLNETLLANQKDFSTKLKAAQSALAGKDAQLQDLQEQVRMQGLRVTRGWREGIADMLIAVTACSYKGVNINMCS